MPLFVFLIPRLLAYQHHPRRRSALAENGLGSDLPQPACLANRRCRAHLFDTSGFRRIGQSEIGLGHACLALATRPEFEEDRARTTVARAPLPLGSQGVAADKVDVGRV